jgi:formate hydrogenlyase subunit 3/multisubunit Na+/H+ antiporter MnhD subunit
MTNHLSSLFKLDTLNGFVVLAIGLFSVLTLIYSSRFITRKHKPLQYYTYIILTAAASIGAVLANNLILVLVFWGFLGLTLYLLINSGDADTAAVAKKTFIIVGGSDALMLLGIGIIYYLTGTFQMDQIRISLSTIDYRLSTIAYLCLAIACFAKAGVMPFHTWIPDCAQAAPVPVVAFLPASLDKLLGIYLLARISLNMFVMNTTMNIFLMLIGAFTIIAAVMMALVQHNMKRLLGYHAVSQVGYMVLGIGTGTPIGIAGGIFHMLNHAIYKACLFLAAGNVESKTKTSELDALGGLSKFMPLTYISCLIASLSISGVPPFNGFVSKWMVYQGLIFTLQAPGSRLQVAISILCLAAAMFGSGLTLASFMKLIHATFLGQLKNSRTHELKNEVDWQMWLPPLLLAIICIIFGVFASQIPLRYFILPAVPGVTFIGTWYAGLATLLIFIGFILGILIFKFKNLSPVLRKDSAFTGAETVSLQDEETKVSGTEFYNTIKELGILRGIYKKAEAGAFDIYEQAKNFVFWIGGHFQRLHNGVLPTYLVWCLLGMLALFFTFLVK